MKESSLKILHVLDHFLPYHSGYTYRSLSIFHNLKEKGIEQILLTSAKHKKFEKSIEVVDGFKVYHTEVKKLFFNKLSFAKELHEMKALYDNMNLVLKLNRFDIIHAHSPVLNGMPALIFSKQNNIPILYDIRAFWEDGSVSHGKISENSFKYRTIKFLETFVTKKVDKVSVICKGLKEDLVSRGVSEEKISIHPNGSDEVFDDKLTKKCRHNSNRNFTIGYIGSFYKYEGLDLLIDVMSRLNDSNRNIRCILVGGYEEEKNLKNYVKMLKLQDRVLFTGPIPHNEIPAYYDKMDLLVYPRKKQRLTELVTPLKPLEAMSYGKVVLASDVGGHRELIDHEKDGILFNADDRDDCLQKIKDVANQKYDLENIRLNSINKLKTTRNWTKIVSGYIDIYNQLIKKSKIKNNFQNI